MLLLQLNSRYVLSTHLNPVFSRVLLTLPELQPPHQCVQGKVGLQENEAFVVCCLCQLHPQDVACLLCLRAHGLPLLSMELCYGVYCLTGYRKSQVCHLDIN